MTDHEFEQIAAFMEAQWASDELPESAWLVYRAEWGNHPATQVLAAVRTLAAEGKYRMPTPGEVKRRLVELKFDAPPWGEVERILVQALHRTEEYTRWPEGKSAWEDRIVTNDRQDYIAQQHFLISRFIVERVGWEWLKTWGPEDRTGTAQLRTKWEAFVTEQVTMSLLAEIDPAGLAQIERAQREAFLPPVTREIEP